MTDLSTLIPWVLRRIVNAEYSISCDSEGEIKSADFDPCYGEAKNRFEVIEHALLAAMPAENRTALLSLKDGYTRESLTAAMATIFPDPEGKVAAWLAERLDGATWEGLVTWLDGIYKAAWEGEGAWEGIGPRLARTREGFGTISDAYVEQLVQSSQPESLRMYVEKKYARDLIELFPAIVSRASELMSLRKLSAEPSDLVKRYLNEAVRCYLYGQFLGSLVVSRAAIEASIKDRLQEMEPSAEVEEMRILVLIDIARRKDLLDDALQGWAHDVRMLANRAIHPDRSLSEEDCRLSLHKTRGILEHLYST